MKRLLVVVFTIFCLNSFAVGDEWLEWDNFDSPYGATYWNNIIYISNLGLSDTDSEYSGFISKINRDGVISSHKWVEDLVSPKGMTVHNLVLYVVDVDTVKGFSIFNAEEVFTLKIENAKDLTGIAVLDVDSLIVSDNKTGLLHKVVLSKKSHNQFIDEKIDGLTGLYKQGNRLFFATNGDGKSGNGQVGFIKIRLKFDRETTMLKPFFISNLRGMFYGISAHGNEIYFTEFNKMNGGRLGFYEINDNRLEWFNIENLNGPMLYWQRVDDFYIPIMHAGKLLTIIDVH